MTHSDFLDYPLIEIGNFSLNVSELFLILIIILITWILLFIIKRIVVSTPSKDKYTAARKHSVYLLVKYLVWIIAIVLIIETIGVKVTFLIASSAALLVGLGLGLQQIFQDIVSGVFILFEGTIKVDDILDIGGVVGKIKEIRLRTSTLLTRDGTILIIPNHKFINENVINWSHNLQPTRFRVQVGVSYGSDEIQVRDILYKCIAEHPEVINDQPEIKPIVRIIDFGDSAVVFEILFWSHNMFWIENIKSDIRFMIREKFRENGIVIPFPQRDVHMK
ncbi:MAG: mechanosensitive ion channel protein MscS [Bacteroidetes bacterium]|nr:MAG: mechanosensitive ion channel protein MscS [Bacteroidota bacterium]